MHSGEILSAVLGSIIEIVNLNLSCVFDALSANTGSFLLKGRVCTSNSGVRVHVTDMITPSTYLKVACREMWFKIIPVTVMYFKKI